MVIDVLFDDNQNNHLGLNPHNGISPFFKKNINKKVYRTVIEFFKHFR